jgi:DnaJ family protein A protein 5
MASSVRCHYEIMGVAQDADAAILKKAYRKMALKYHPDKNLGDDDAAEQFRLVQQAYECLSDPQERQWYDDHRDAILAGWSSGGGGGDDEQDVAAMMIFNVVHYMHPGCYSGYHDQEGGFYQVYKTVFEEIVQSEWKQNEKTIELPTDFGNADTSWKEIQHFYQIWESFVSALNFAWEDKYNSREDAPDRRIRRLMEEDNKKARRAAKKTYNQDIVALVAFVKRRDPRVKAKQEEMQLQKLEQQQRQKEVAAQKKLEQQKAKEAWMEEAKQAAEEAEEADRLAGRVRLADLEDDYDYGGGKKKKRGKGKKKKNRKQEEEEEAAAAAAAAEEILEPTLENGETEGGADESELNGEPETETLDVNAEEKEIVVDQEPAPPAVIVDEPAVILEEDDGDDNSESEAENEENPDDWRCECCHKEFKSAGQMENHMTGKKHKEAFEIYQAKMKKIEKEKQAAAALAAAQAAEEAERLLEDDDDYSESEEESEEDSWRCECCRKDFKSEGQMENHTKSKKHKEAFKKYQAKMKKKEDEMRASLLDEVAMEP